MSRRTRRDRSRLGVLVVVLAIGLLVGVAIGSGTGTAAPDYLDADEACETHSDAGEFSLLVLLENGNAYGPGEEVALYPGTNARIVLCDDGNTPEDGSSQAWDLLENDLLEFDHPEDTVYYAVSTASDPPSESRSLEQLISEDRRADATGPMLSVATANEVAIDHLGDDDRVAVHITDTERRESFENRLNTYGEARERADDLQAELEAATARESPTTADIEPEDVNETVSELKTAHRAFEAALFEAAYDGSDPAVDALGSHRETHATTVESVEVSQDGYLEAAESEAQDARLVAIGAVFGPFVAFALGGVLIGRKLSTRDLESIRRERRRRQSVDYGWSDLKKAFAIATVGIVAGLLVFVYAIGIADSPIIEVIL